MVFLDCRVCEKTKSEKTIQIVEDFVRDRNDIREINMEEMHIGLLLNFICAGYLEN